MKHGSFGGPLRFGAGLAVLLVFAACSETGPTSSMDEPALAGVLTETTFDVQIGNPATANGELFEVCKRWVGNPATANFTVDGGGGPIAFDDSGFLGPFSDGGVAGSHNDWFCADVWLDGGPRTVTVDETGVSGGANPYATTVVAVGTGNHNLNVVGTAVSANIQGAGGASGVVAFYTNTEEVPPGDKGCTPGYWKQEHHHDSWIHHSPGDDFDATFGVAAIPLRKPESGTTAGMTLQEGLELRGGGVNALIRHAVAALLNADQGFYPMTEAEVFAAFQAAVGGGDIEGTKDTFAANNELGCPLS